MLFLTVQSHVSRNDIAACWRCCYQCNLLWCLWKCQPTSKKSRIAQLRNHSWNGIRLCSGKHKIFSPTTLHLSQSEGSRHPNPDSKKTLRIATEFSVLFYPLRWSTVFCNIKFMAWILQQRPAVPWKSFFSRLNGATCGSLECVSTFQVERGNLQT